MHPIVVDAAGRRRHTVTLPGYHAGRPPRNKGRHYPADPPTVEEIVVVMRAAGASCLALDAEKCLLLDGEKIIEAARQRIPRTNRRRCRRFGAGSGVAPTIRRVGTEFVKTARGRTRRDRHGRRRTSGVVPTTMRFPS